MPEARTARDATSTQPTLVRGLGLMDSVLLLVGGIIGSAIFLTPRDVAAQLPRAPLFLLAWAAGGVITLLACFAMAELGAMYPQAGGHYVYLREAFGELVAFLYGWMVFTVNSTGSIGAISVAFASYFGVLVPPLSADHVIVHVSGWQLNRAHLVALAATVLLTWVNIIGLRRAATVQNIAAWMKYLAMAAFIGLGFLIGRGSFSHFSAAPATASGAGMGSGALLSAFGVALIAIFWAYDGWQYISWAAGEVSNPQRNIPRALVMGVIAVAVIYVCMNAVYIYAMPVSAIAAGEQTTARAAAVTLFSPAVGKWLSALIAVSCFGALCANILGGARVFYAMANDGLFFRRMGAVHPVYRTSAFSLVVQTLWGAVLIVSGSYDQLFTYLMFMGVLSYTLTVVGLFVLRRTRPDVPRPYRCTGYPWAPALYVVVSAAWALNTLWQRPKESLAGVAIVLLGLPAYFYWRRTAGKAVA